MRTEPVIDRVLSAAHVSDSRCKCRRYVIEAGCKSLFIRWIGQTSIHERGGCLSRGCGWVATLRPMTSIESAQWNERNAQVSK